jgi:hypothetical protein
MNDILVDQVKLLPVPEDTEKSNHPKPDDLFAHQSQFPRISGSTLRQSRNIRVLLETWIFPVQRPPITHHPGLQA